MNKKLEALQKEINGKRVKWVYEDFEDIVKVSAILIWPPGGDSIVVKPYGYKRPESIARLMRGLTASKLKDVKDPSYCLSRMKASMKYLEYIKKVAAIPEGGEYDFEKIADFPYRGNPVCPYV